MTVMLALADEGGPYPYRTRWDIPPNVPVPVTEIDPEADPGLADAGRDAYCSICGPESSPRHRVDLMAVRQKTVEELAGPVWKYCREHVPDREWQPGGWNDHGRRVREVTCSDCFLVVAVGSICDASGRPHDMDDEEREAIIAEPEVSEAPASPPIVMTQPEPVYDLIQPPALPPLDGDEPFIGLPATVSDFWRFALPDLRMNNVRGWFAEYLVWRALGVDHPRRIEWDAFDVEWEGIRIEVKSSAYLQAWRQRALSKLVFTGLAARYWRADEIEVTTERTNNADVYVFAVQTATGHDDYDPLDITQWRFAVLARSVLARLGVRSLTWSRVVAEAGGETPFDGLADAVRAAAATDS